MNAVLALFPDYEGVDVGVGQPHPTVRRVGWTQDIFRVGEDLLGRAPRVVVAPEGPENAPWHPTNRLTEKVVDYCRGSGTARFIRCPGAKVVLREEALLSGFPGFCRKNMYCGVPTAAIWARGVASLTLDPKTARVISVYLGDETVVASHVGENVVDASIPVFCEGPFGITSAGTLPGTSFMAYASEKGASLSSTEALLLRDRLKSGSGALAYAGVADRGSFAQALARDDSGAKRAVLGMAYQVAKECGRQVAALNGQVDAIVISGPGTGFHGIVTGVEARVAKWARVLTVEEDLVIPHLLDKGI